MKATRVKNAAQAQVMCSKQLRSIYSQERKTNWITYCRAVFWFLWSQLGFMDCILGLQLIQRIPCWKRFNSFFWKFGLCIIQSCWSSSLFILLSLSNQRRELVLLMRDFSISLVQLFSAVFVDDTSDWYVLGPYPKYLFWDKGRVYFILFLAEGISCFYVEFEMESPYCLFFLFTYKQGLGCSNSTTVPTTATPKSMSCVAYSTSNDESADKTHQHRNWWQQVHSHVSHKSPVIANHHPHGHAAVEIATTTTIN